MQSLPLSVQQHQPLWGTTARTPRSCALLLHHLSGIKSKVVPDPQTARGRPLHLTWGAWGAHAATCSTQPHGLRRSSLLGSSARSRSGTTSSSSSGSSTSGSSSGGSSSRQHTCAAAAGDHSQPAVAPSLSAQLEALAARADALYRFTRPHTMLGTFVSIVSVSLMAMQSFTWSSAALAGLLTALVPALLMNVAIVGINQLYDVDIDKVNKPYLPLASGEMSMAQGVWIVVVCAVLSLACGVWSGSPALLVTLAGSLVLGVLYSIELPFMRWKRSPWLAALCILAVRAVMVQAGFYLHMQHALGLDAPAAATAAAAATGGGTGLLAGVQCTLTRPLGFTIAFMLIFSVVIALFKDLPDVKGDTAAGVRTFSVRHGARAVFDTCTALLLAAYAGGVAFAATSPEPWSRLPVALGHIGLAALLWRRSRAVNPARKQDLTEHYMLVWKLFYAEYLIIPFLR